MGTKRHTYALIQLIPLHKPNGFMFSQNCTLFCNTLFYTSNCSFCLIQLSVYLYNLGYLHFKCGGQNVLTDYFDVFILLRAYNIVGLTTDVR